MSDDFLRERKNALEEAFFAAENERLRQRLRDADTAKSKKQALADASGITDDAVLDRLAALNFAGDTLAALSLAPLVLVAWADGGIDERERDAVLAGAAEAGVGKQHVAYPLLDRWLREPPPRDLLTSWVDYIRAASATLDEAGRQALKADLLGRARRVAEAAGGFLGLGRKISASEEAVLQSLETAFHPGRPGPAA